MGWAVWEWKSGAQREGGWEYKFGSHPCRVDEIITGVHADRGVCVGPQTPLHFMSRCPSTRGSALSDPGCLPPAHNTHPAPGAECPGTGFRLQHPGLSLWCPGRLTNGQSPPSLPTDPWGGQGQWECGGGLVSEPLPRAQGAAWEVRFAFLWGVCLPLLRVPAFYQSPSPFLRILIPTRPGSGLWLC